MNEMEIFKQKKVGELREILKALGVKGISGMKKQDMLDVLQGMHDEAERQRAAGADELDEEPKKDVEALEDDISEQDSDEAAEEDSDEENGREDSEANGKKVKVHKDGREEKTGILEIAEGGFGFLRFDNFLTSDEDIYVSPTQIRRFNLKTGDKICGIARKPGDGERFGALLYVKTVNDDEPGVSIHRKDFSELTPIYPDKRIWLDRGSNALSMRLTDLVAPIGLGQRGLIVAPPKAGKTTLLKQIAKAIENQDLDVELMVLLIDERPEEVTDMQRSIRGQVIYSTFDEQPQNHVKVAEMVLARAQRFAEHHKNVIILLDSITRLARAYNLVEPPSGRTLSGGLDPSALYKPKKFFGAARNLEEGGSITILSTALIETGSRMDDMIFEEFKGTGNMELHLDRNLSEKRIFPAININKSGTRREDMLMVQEELEAVWMMRRAVANWGIEDATERVMMELAHTKTNDEFIRRFRRIRL
ncbi:MAG: transcription termination factor Rho [Clostridiales bacterium]|nr:transcription termination factor Rho [Clostridiales bacterium]